MTIFSELGVREGADRLDEEVAYNLAEIYARGYARLARCLAPHGLTPAALNVLLMVRYVGGGDGLSQRAISERMIVSTSNVTGMVDRLERQRLVERVPDPDDRRVNRVRVTAAGTALLDRLWPGYVEEIRAFLAPVPAGERKNLAQLLDDWRRALAEEAAPVGAAPDGRAAE